MDEIRRSGIMTGLQNIWSSSQYWDIIVRSGSEEFKLYRAIICPRSKFFAAACNGPFQEGRTAIITLQGDDSPTVRRMFEYLYTLDYDDNGEMASVADYAHGKGASGDLQATTVTEDEQLSAHDPPDYHQLMNNVAVYAIADKYDIPELEVLAVAKFEKALLCWTHAKPPTSLPVIIGVVFDTTPDTKCGLRDVMLRYCKRWNKEIINDKDAAAIVRDYGQIGLAIIHEMSDKHRRYKRSMEAQIEGWMEREKTLKRHLENISRAAKCMTILDAREVKQSTMLLRRLKLKEAIQDYQWKKY